MSKNTNLSFLTDYITADITNGRIGINNASPTVAFDVSGITKFSSDVTTGGKILISDGGSGLIPCLKIGSATTGISQNVSEQLNFITSGTTKMVITSVGNVGIGTTTPTAKMQILITSAGAATVGLLLNNNSTSANTEIRLAFAANTNDEIASNRYSYISALNTSGSNGQALIFATNETGNSGTERMRILSTGQVLVGGTSSDGYGFQVYGATSLNGQVKFTQVTSTYGQGNENTVVVNGSSASYFLNKDTGTAVGGGKTYFDITGLSNAAGTIAHITIRVSKGVTVSASNTIAVVLINGADMTGEVFVTGTGASTTIKTFTVVYNTTTGWQIIGAVGTY